MHIPNCNDSQMECMLYYKNYANLEVCRQRDGECGSQLVSIIRQLPHHKMVVMDDLSDCGIREVLQRPHPLVLLLSHVCVQIYPGCLREMQGFQEAHWVALYIKELCAEVQWIFALQEFVGCTTAIHSFNATPLSQSNHLVDQVDVEEKGLWWNFLLAVVQGVVEDLQCLRSACMLDLIV